MTQTKKDEVLDEAVIAALLEAIPPATPPAKLRERVLNQIDSTRRRAGVVTIRADAAAWKTLIPGVEFKILVYDEQAGSKSFLLRAAAGMRLPPHGHHGYEECLVLEGEFSLGDLILRAGDFHGVTSDIEHGEAYTASGVTVYLRATTKDYPGIAP